MVAAPTARNQVPTACGPAVGGMAATWPPYTEPVVPEVRVRPPLDPLAAHEAPSAPCEQRLLRVPASRVVPRAVPAELLTADMLARPLAAREPDGEPERTGARLALEVPTRSDESTMREALAAATLPAAAQAEQERRELVKVAAALCSDVQALQGRSAVHGEDIHLLKTLQKQHSSGLEELQNQQCSFLLAMQTQLSGQVREVHDKFTIEISQLTCLIDALQGLCKTNSDSLEVLQEELRTHREETTQVAKSQPCTSELELAANVQALRDQHCSDICELQNRCCGQLASMEAAQATVLADVETLRKQLFDLAQTSAPLLDKHSSGIEDLRRQHGVDVEGLRDELRSQSLSLEALQSLRNSEAEAARSRHDDGLESLESEVQKALEVLRDELCSQRQGLEALHTQRDCEVVAAQSHRDNDFDSLQSHVRMELEAVRDELSKHTGDVDALHSQHGREIEAVRGELSKHIDNVQALHLQRDGEIQADQLTALRSEFQSDLEALRQQLRSCQYVASPDTARLKLQNDVDKLHSRLREMEEAQSQTSRWSLMDALHDQLGCNHSAAEAARSRQSRALEELRSEAREHEQHVQTVEQQCQEKVEGLRGDLAKVYAAVQSHVDASIQALRMQVVPEIGAVHSLHGENAAGLEALQKTCNGGIQALRSQHTHIMTVQEQLMDDIGAIKSQLVDNIKVLQNQDDAHSGMIEALQSQHERRGGELEALRGEHRAFARRHGEELEELRNTGIRLDNRLEELQSAQDDMVPPVYQI